MTRRASWILLVVALAIACDAGPPESPAPASRPAPTTPEAPAPAEYAGRARCAGCHPEQLARFAGSHHDLAMQEAGPGTVLGDFEDAQFTHFGVTTTFSRDGERFLVHTEDADGALREFEVAYTFGVDPLQQYLLPTEGGRLQALGIAWDSRPAENGGQRWFALHPDEAIAPDDVLHWTADAQNWNYMCADCHSTNLARGYDGEGDRYETTWSEIDISCEACHGPASRHVAWAVAGALEGTDSGLVVDLANDASWRFDDNAPIAGREPARTHSPELDVCGRCHARRAVIAAGFEPGQPLLDAYHPALLDEGLYFADGQIDDEVYVWGSFLQSRMHAAGVTCSDCHDPHSLAVAERPDDTCLTCHQSESFATPDHHRHAPQSAGASCLGCHMPARTYMVVDDRRDHGFRVPRPAHSAALGAPDPCTACHTDRSPAWAQNALEQWGRTPEPSSYGAALLAGRRAAPGAAAELVAVSTNPAEPALVRASALRLLGRLPPPRAVDAILEATRDDDPVVRMAAAEAAEALPPPTRLAIAPLLRDRSRAVRIEAARVLADVPAELWPPGGRALLARTLAEYRDAQSVNAERPEAHVNLGNLHTRLGELEAAERAYRTALERGPYFIPAYVNLADLYRSLGREDEGRGMLRAGLERSPDNAALHHALGLALVRAGEIEDALGALARAAELEPEAMRYGYVYGIALSSSDPSGALAYLAELQQRHPGDPELVAALATLSRDTGHMDEALVWARKLATLLPDDEGVKALVSELEGAGG